MVKIYIDADACPVKDETYRVAKRYSLQVVVVSHHALVVPKADGIVPIVVAQGFDAVDNWIEAEAAAFDIVITNDILLAERCIKKGALVTDPRGRILDENNIGEAVVRRELLDELRQRGEIGLGPQKHGKKQNSNFLSSLDTLINRAKKNTPA